MASSQAADHPERPELDQAGLNTPCGAATDSQGNLYVAVAGESKVAVFDKAGDPLTSFATTANTGLPCSLATDSAGNVYVTGLEKEVARYKPASFPPASGTAYAPDTTIGGGTGVLLAGAPASVAVDPETQNAYVAEQALGEQQVLNFSGLTAAVSKYTLTFEGVTTSEITHSGTAGVRSTRIREALEEKFGVGNFIVASSGNGTTAAGTSTITFVGKYLGLDVPPIECTITAPPGACTVTQGREAKPSKISSFEPDGTLITDEIGEGLVAQADFYGIDVHGESGNVYVTDRAHNKALILNPDGSAILSEIDGSEAPTGAFTAMRRPYLAVDQADGNVFVSDIPGHGVVNEFDKDGKYVSQLTHTPAFTESTLAPSDIAVDSSPTSDNYGTIYVTSSEDGNVYAFGPDPHKPPLTPLTVNKTGAGAGTVTSAPAGINCGPTCTGEFLKGKTVVLTAQPEVPGSVFGEWSGCDTVSANKCEVTMNETRTVSVRFDSRPVVSEVTASQLTASSARLEAMVDPQSKATTYFFEYIAEEDWLTNGKTFTGAVATESTPIGAGNSPVPVGVKVEGLEPSTAYRFRILATNNIGTAEGEGAFSTFSPPQVFEPCANDARRVGPSANLPDCRAYEQASPVDKNGGSIQATGMSARAADDGSAISFESTTGVPVPDGSGAQTFPTYVAKRTDSGGGSWATTGLLPEPSSGQRARVLGWTPDFATVFDQAELLGEGRSLLARETGEGVQTEIVPHTPGPPSYSYLGASADGSRIAFEATPEVGDTTLQLTPDSAAGKPNVYAWDRGEPGELHLAGVLPDGTTPPEGSQAGRGPSGKEYNHDTHLVGADGSVLFNDAGTGQLYLRLNPTAEETGEVDSKGNCVPDPELACTVHVSASHKTNGKGPEGRDAAGPQPATFMAASTDGSVITFTSSEKLTNDANTGPEPEAPAIARAKAGDGGEKNLGFIPAFANEIAIDQVGGHVYWSDLANGRIGRAKLDGTDFTEDYVTGLGEPIGIAVINDPSSKYIFWTERGELDEDGKAQTGQGTIGRVDLDGANANPACITGLTNPRSIAADASFIYWTMPGITPSEEFLGQGDMGRATLDCVSDPLPTPIDNLASGDVAVNATHIYYSFARDDGVGPSFIARANLDGSGDLGGIVEASATSEGAAGIALSATHLYWGNPVGFAIGRSDLDGTNASEEHGFLTAAGRAGDLGIGGEHVFWTVNQKVAPNPGNDIYQLDLESGELTDLAPDSVREKGVEAQGVLGASEDGSYVYFAANGVPDELGNSPNERGEEAEPGDCKGTERTGASGTCSLYVAHEGEVDFIARLDATPPSPERDSGDALNWARGHLDIEEPPSDKTARVSADGQILVFRSSRQLTEFENEGPRCGATEAGVRIPGPCPEFYRFDHEEMGLGCLTCDPRGTTPEGPARLGTMVPPDIGAPEPQTTLPRNLTRDGNRFFFQTPDALVAADTNGENGCPAWGTDGVQKGNNRACQDVYEWEAPGVGSCTESSPAFSEQNEGCIYLISTGKSKEASFFADADTEGENAFIFTYEQLVAQDKDALLDAYDARVNGGIEAQNQPDPPICVGDTCKPTPTSPAPAQTPGSSNFTGPGNAKQGAKPKPRRCAKGKRKVRVKGKTRCVPKKRNRNTSKSRGAGR